MDAKKIINLSYAKLNRGIINGTTEVRYGQTLLLNGFFSSYLPKYILFHFILFLRLNDGNNYRNGVFFINWSYAKLNRGIINRNIEERY